MPDYTERFNLQVKWIIDRAAFSVDYGDRLLEEWSTHGDQRDDWSGAIPGAKAATAYLAAVEALLLVDQERARAVARKAADLYVRLGMPIGALLRSVFRLSDPFDTPASGWLTMIVRESKEPHKDLATVPPALSYPNQQFTVALALLTQPATAGEFRDSLDRLLRRLLQDHAVTPHGPQGLPLARYVYSALHLLAAAEPSGGLVSNKEEQLKTFWRTLRPIASAQAEALQGAQFNRYLWDQALSPVSLVDFDLQAIALAGLRLGDASHLSTKDVPDELRTTVDIARALDPPHQERGSRA